MDVVGACIEVYNIDSFWACPDNDLLLKVAEALLLYISQLTGQLRNLGLEIRVSMESGQSRGTWSNLVKCKVQGT